MEERKDIPNPFEHARVFYENEVSSTMDVGRQLMAQGMPHGTVITTGRQVAGHGRTAARPWLSNEDALAFTILLRYAGWEAIPKAITLKTGLAVARGIESFIAKNLPEHYAKQTKPFALVKWPNDIIVFGKKVCGIVTEARSGEVLIGIGVNVNQQTFPESLQKKAVSLAIAFEPLANEARFALLASILVPLKAALSDSGAGWREALCERLFMRGQGVRFLAGGADSGESVEGILAGVNEDGELLLARNGGVSAYISGELDVYRGA